MHIDRGNPADPREVPWLCASASRRICPYACGSARAQAVTPLADDAWCGRMFEPAQANRDDFKLHLAPQTTCCRVEDDQQHYATRPRVCRISCTVALTAVAMTPSAAHDSALHRLDVRDLPSLPT